MNMKKRWQYFWLTLLFLFSYNFVFVRQVIAFEENIAQQEQRKGLFDDIKRVVGGKKKVCIAGLCVKTGRLTETIFAKQLKQLAQKNAPVTISSDNLYPVTESLPGSDFNPSILDLRNAAQDDVIPPGDYIIPVEVYCLQKVASSPKAHRYLLGKYGGKRKEVLAALNKAATNSDIPHKDLQNLSWAIQAGVSYQNMPDSMQLIADKLIPDYRSQLKQEWWKQIETAWNKGSKLLNLPSFDRFVTSNLGELGSTLLAFRQTHQRLVNRGRDWRNLSNIFIIDDGTQGVGNVSATPWSQVANNIHARFVTGGNAQDIGLLMIRVGNKQSGKEASNGNKALPLLPIAAAALTVYDFYDLVTTLSAIPEGNGNIQPLAMSAALGTALYDNGLDAICNRRRIPRGRLSATLSILCNASNGNLGFKKPRKGKPGNAGGGGNNNNGGNNNGGDNNNPPPRNIAKSSITKPSLPLGSKPKGKRTPINPQSSREIQRSIKRENDSADILANKGYDVEQNPGKLPNGKNPDYKIEGKIFDCYSPSSSKVEQVRTGTKNKLRKEQADRIILDLEDTTVTAKEVQSILSRKPIKGLKEVIAIKNGQIIQLFP